MAQVKYTNKAEFIAAMQLGNRLWHKDLDFGRLEKGVVDFGARDGNKLYVVCIKMESLCDFQELDISSEETLESLSYAEQLYVAIRNTDKPNEEDEVLFNSFKY